MCFTPFLKTGTIWAFFQSVGTSSESREHSYSLVRIGAYWIAADFKVKTGTSSGPVALCILRSLNSLRTLVPFIRMCDWSSLLYAETNWLFKISTFELLSL